MQNLLPISQSTVSQPVCRLCLQIKKLSDSHIIPHGLIRISKAGHKQLIAIDSTPDAPPRLDNANWTEQLLCGECELFLNEVYEKPQLAKLKGARDKIDLSYNRLTIYNLDYRKFYLFWLSVLWRASISSHEAFPFTLPTEVNDLMRHAIQQKDPAIGGWPFQSYVQIGLVRVVSEYEYDATATRGLMTSFYSRPNGRAQCYVFVVAGFAVLYQISDVANSDMPSGFKAIKHSRVYRMPKLPPSKCTVVDHVYSLVMDKPKRYPSGTV